jgi:hypothetical protein
MADKPSPAKVQPDDVPVGLMFALLGGLVAIVLVIMIVTWQFFGKTADETLAKQNLAKKSRNLKQVNAIQGKLYSGFDVWGYRTADDPKRIFSITRVTKNGAPHYRVELKKGFKDVPVAQGLHSVIDTSQGVYRIPVERARQMVLSNPKLLAPVAAATNNK